MILEARKYLDCYHKFYEVEITFLDNKKCHVYCLVGCTALDKIDEFFGKLCFEIYFVSTIIIKL